MENGSVYKATWPLPCSPPHSTSASTVRESTWASYDTPSQSGRQSQPLPSSSITADWNFAVKYPSQRGWRALPLPFGGLSSTGRYQGTQPTFSAARLAVHSQTQEAWRVLESMYWIKVSRSRIRNGHVSVKSTERVIRTYVTSWYSRKLLPRT